MIHKFSKNDKYFVLDVESGTVLETDELGYSLLGEDGLNEEPESPLSREYSKEEIKETKEEFKSLIDQDILYADPIKNLIIPEKNGSIKALCLHVAHDCNLRCTYCFAGQGDFKGERSLMKKETARKAIDFVIKESGNRHNIEVDFFGGEPLMNFEVVKDTVAYARSLEKEKNKKFKFTVTTNGVLLDKEKREWLDQNMDNVVLSLDGRKETNDRLRKTVNGQGSYDVIIDNIKEMAALREGKKDYYVRGTYTALNPDFSEDVKAIYENGIKSISVEPVVAEKGSVYELKKEHLEGLKEEYRKLAEYNLNNDFTFFHFNIDLDAGPCLYKRLSGCGAGTDYLAVTPEGKLFPCHQFVSDESFCIGDIFDGIKNPEILTAFSRSSLDKKETCQSCWCKYFCGGGCHANNYSFNKTLEEPYQIGCELEKERVEDAIMLYALKN